MIIKKYKINEAQKKQLHELITHIAKECRTNPYFDNLFSESMLEPIINDIEEKIRLEVLKEMIERAYYQYDVLQHEYQSATGRRYEWLK